MTDKSSEPKAPTPADTRNHAIRTQALDLAIRSNCGQSHDVENRMVFNADKIVEAAKKFETFIKGDISEKFIESHSNNPKIPEAFKNQNEAMKQGSW